MTTATRQGSFQQARERLGSAQKSRAGVPAYTRYVNRPLGGIIAAWSYSRGLTPDQLTTASAVLSFGGLALLAAAGPSSATGVLTAVLLAAGYVLDSADGQLARLRGVAGRGGEFYDHVVDVAKSVALHGTVVLTVLRAGLPWQVVLLPLGFALTAQTHFFAMMLRDEMLRGRATPDQVSSSSSRQAIVLLPLDFGTLAWSFLLVGALPVFLAVYGLLGLALLAFAVRSLPKARRLVAWHTAPAPAPADAPPQT